MFPLTEFPIYEVEAGLRLHQPTRYRIRFLGIPDLGLLFPNHMLFLHHRAAREDL